MSVRMEYDQNGRIISQIFADGKSWSYTYLEKVGKAGLVLLYSAALFTAKFLLNFHKDFFSHSSSGCTAPAEAWGKYN